MSKETTEVLNSNLVGFSDILGMPWWFDEDAQPDEPTVYPGAIPVEDVRRRLFNWQAQAGPVTTSFPLITPEGVETVTITDPMRKAIIRPDTRTILGLFKDGYQIHQFDKWLLDEVAAIISGDLSIGSAGLLKGGAVAWVSIEVPDSIVTPEGVEFRPKLLACTSHDGSLATTFQRVVTNVVCDNTMSAALGESKDQRIKIKHSRYSGIKLNSDRAALGIVHMIEENFTAEVAALCDMTVTPGQWEAFMDEIAPLPEKAGRGLTMAENKRAEYARLWAHDDRVSPWKGTAWGVVQAVNTYTHHSGIVRGADRNERNMLRAVTGGADKLDKDTLKTLVSVL